MMFKYDTHIHTADVSGCASASGIYQAVAFKEAGYDGIIITNHFFRGKTCLVPKNLSWEERINTFCSGYEKTKQCGDEIGLKVFFGWEETYDGQDFLIYGLDKEWLLKHPEMEHWTLEQQFHEVDKNGGMVIHAHPFRDRPYIPKIRLFPKLVHGVEIFNAGNYESENRKAYMYAKEYDLPTTCGSDNHHHDIVFTGIETEQPLNSIQDYIRLIRKREQKQIIYPDD